MECEKLATDGPEAKTENVRSVERALSIVSVVAASRGSLSVGDIADQMKLHPATVHRLLGTLVRFGWIEQNADTSRYKLGVRLLGLGATALNTHPLVQHSRESLRRLAEVSEFTSYLSVLAGKRVAYLARSAGKLSMNLEFEAGASHPAHATADGKLLLAYLPEGEREQLLEDMDLRGYTEHTFVDKDELNRELSGIRSRGYAVDRGERWDFLRGVAVPVLDPREVVIASLSCYGRVEVTQDMEKHLPQEMMLVAEDFAHRLAIS
jgi:DNA-binding IclR family transcriptional regulator